MLVGPDLHVARSLELAAWEGTVESFSWMLRLRVFRHLLHRLRAELAQLAALACLPGPPAPLLTLLLLLGDLPLPLPLLGFSAQHPGEHPWLRDGDELLNKERGGIQFKVK